MKKLFLFLLLVLFLLPFPVLAQTAQSGENVVLAKDKTVDENYFAAGGSVTVSGTVNGDAYVAGGNVLVDGTVNGDLLVAGGSVNIAGVVKGDIRTAGGNITISGTVDGNVTAMGGTINVVKTAVIGKSIVAAGGQLNMMAPIPGGATIAGGQVTLSNTVGGNVLAATENLLLTTEAKVAGNIQYYSENKAEMQPGATVSGTVKFHQQQYKEKMREKTQTAKEAGKSAGFIFKIYSLITAFIIGAIFIMIAPHFMKKAADQINGHMLASMGMGLLILVLTPIVILVLFVSILGIPFALFLSFMYVIYLYIAKIFVALFLGEKIFSRFKMQQNMYVTLLAGLLAVVLVSAIPVLGGLIYFLILLTGIGTLFLTKKEYISTLKTKKLI